MPESTTHKSVWYRVVDQAYASVDESERVHSHVEVHLHQYVVLSTTPKGVWLQKPTGEKRFVRLEARKRFACPTIKEAYESFIARRKRQRSIYSARVRRCDEVIAKAELAIWRLDK